MALVESFSGIRGIYGKELNEEIIKKYALAYFLLLKKNNPLKEDKSIKIVIGRDSRISGKEILNIFKGTLDVEIIDVGLMPTPVIENAVRAFNADGGIIITASHNEPEFNGFKFLDKDGAVLRPKDIDFVINQVKTITKTPKRNINKNVINKEREALSEYKKILRDILKTDRIEAQVNIVVDPNGGSGIVAKEIFEDFGINADYINMIPGKFLRLIEPKEESLLYLKEYMKEKNADFAVGFDCDADRVEILLKDGTLISGNEILSIITEEILSGDNTREKVVVANDATSYCVKEIAEKYGAKFKEVEVGEINVVDEMLASNSKIGGEGSNGGVIIFPSRCRDGILTIIVLLKIIQNRKIKLKEIIQNLPKYYYIKEKIMIKEDFIKMKDEIREHYLNNGFKIIQTGDETGGLKAIKNNSWIWLRQSKTEDKVLRIIADSKIKDTAEELLNEAKNLID